MPPHFQKQEYLHHQSVSSRETSHRILKKYIKQANKRRINDPQDEGIKPKHQKLDPTTASGSNPGNDNSMPTFNNKIIQCSDFWYSSAPISQYKSGKNITRSQPLFNEWWMRHAQASESPIGTAHVVIRDEIYAADVNRIVQMSNLAQWLHDSNQLIQNQGDFNFVNIQPPITEFQPPNSARHENFFMNFSSNAFDTALSYISGYPDLMDLNDSDPVDLLRAFAYLQCPKFPETYLMRLLPNMKISTWAKFTFLHQFFMQNDITTWAHLNDFNLWNVRMPSINLKNTREPKPRPFDFCRAARSSRRAFRHWANRIHGGRCIKCSQPFERSELIHPTKFQSLKG